MKSYMALAAAILVLMGCATPTVYSPATGPEGFGFSEQQIDSNSYRISFSGNSSTTRTAVENSLLYRAAELTLAKGYDYFVISENDVEVRKTYSVTSAYPAYYGRYWYVPSGPGRYRAFPYYAYGFDWGVPYRGDVRELTRYSAFAYVSMFKGQKPEDDPQAFDAHTVESNLRSAILFHPM